MSNQGLPLSKFSLLLILGAALTCAGCERKAPDYVAREARGKETALHYDSQADRPRFIKMKKKDARSKEAVARRRELKKQIKDNYRKGQFFE